MLREARCVSGMTRRLLTLLVLAAGAAGCTTAGSPGGLFAGGRGATIAFESIDGPPPGVFQKLVSTLGEEAEARKVAVVSREGAASYRVRAYLSAQVERGKTSIAWVWDVYDADKRRALRIAGQEPSDLPAGPKGRDAWSAADDRMLRQIARNGLDRVAAFLNGSEQPAPAEPSGGTAVAEAETGEPETGPVRTAGLAP
jgi:hypothetical protein